MVLVISGGGNTLNSAKNDMAHYFKNYKGQAVGTMVEYFAEMFGIQLEKKIESIKYYVESGYPKASRNGNLYARSCDQYKHLIKTIKNKMMEEGGYSESYTMSCIGKMVKGVCVKLDFTLPRCMPTEKTK